MGEQAPSAPEVAALVDALLRHHDKLLGEPDEPLGLPDRPRLSWLAAPWAVVVAAVRAVASGFQPSILGSHEQLVGVYRRLGGKDPGVAQAEVARMTDQLFELDQRVRLDEDDPPGAWPGADRVGLEAAAEALAGYYLGGRRTDDVLLAEAQAVWAELEDVKERWPRPAAGGGSRGWRRVGTAEDEELQDELTGRYLDAWRRWLEVGPRAAAHSAATPPSWRGGELRGKGEPEDQGRRQDLAALRDALLRHCEERSRPIADSRSMRVARRLRRAHLLWLVTPWLWLLVVRIFLLGRRPAVRASEDQAVGLYRQLSGRDSLTARAEIGRLVQQLFPLDHPMGWAGDDGRADRAELEAAADALLAWYLADRQTDDALLGEVLGVWAEWEDLTEWEREQLTQRGWLRGRRAARARQDAEQPIRERYLAAWRRWLDQRAPHATSPGPGAR